MNAPLLPRQQQVLELMAGGLTYGQIAERTHLSLSTVKTHAGRMFARFGVHDRASAVAAGYANGFLQLPAGKQVTAPVAVLAGAVETLRMSHPRHRPAVRGQVCMACSAIDRLAALLPTRREGAA